MKHVLYFATKLNSRDIQKCDCLWVPSYDLFVSARKAVFPASTATGFHRLRKTWSSLPSQGLVGGGVGEKSNLPQKVQQSFLNQNLDLPQPPNEKFLDFPLQRCYSRSNILCFSEFGAIQGLCWRVQVNQFFSS